MGFGSYDESEQRDPDVSTGEGDEEQVERRGNDYEGSMSFESGASTDDLLDRLDGFKDDGDEE